MCPNVLKVTERPFWILPTIVFSQFACTSLWFAGNAVISDLQRLWGLGHAALSYITSSVQFGFIVGTLLFAFFTISDRFSSRIVFFTCALLGALSNLCVYFLAKDLASLLFFRFLTGFFLAGIYPVGMKIAAGWYQKGLGSAMGFLVGATVVGTGFPHLIKSIGLSLPWEFVILSVSGFSVFGGILLVLLVPDGPYLTIGTKFNSRAFLLIFKTKDLRCAAFGYFGHMWELFTLWAFIPLFLNHYSGMNMLTLNVSFWTFCVIAIGFVGCSGGGLLSKKLGSPSVAFYQLSASCICCLLSPMLFHVSLELFLIFILFWGIVVVGDSPQFSALTAQTAPQELVGSALTIVNSIGFFITIFSIQFTNYLTNFLSPKHIFLFLVPGPIFGLIYLWPLLKRKDYTV
jgi:MFS family permease